MPVDPLLAPFTTCNPAIWPVQPIADAGALALLGLVVLTPSRRANQLVSGFLAARASTPSRVSSVPRRTADVRGPAS